MMQLGISPATTYSNSHCSKQEPVKPPRQRFGVNSATDYLKQDDQIASNGAVPPGVQSAARADSTQWEKKVSQLQSDQKAAQAKADQLANQYLRFTALA